MRLSDTERQCLTTILAQYDQHPEVQRMREFIQHGDVTTYQHCKNVVLVSFWLNRRFHLGADETSLAVGPSSMTSISTTGTSHGSFRGLRRLFEMHGFAHPALPASMPSAASPSPEKSRTSSRAICGP